MSQLPHFWRAVEGFVGQAAAAAEWMRLPAEEMAVAHRLLRPRGGLASSLPRQDAGLPPLRLVRHGPDDWVGVCPLTGDVTRVSEADLVVYELDLAQLARALGATLGFTAPPVVEPGPVGSTRVLGVYQPAAGYAVPVYLVVPPDGRALTRAACEVGSAGPSPYLLVAPTRDRLRAEALTVLGRYKSSFLALEEALEFSPSGDAALTPTAEAELGRFRALNLPAAGAAEGFPTPVGATWADLRVRFVDDHTVSVSVHSVGKTLNYTQFGMADRRSGRPTKQWQFLRLLSRRYGVYSWRGRTAGDGERQRRRLLANDLKAYFRIDGNPIEQTPEGDGWRTAFTLEPENEVKQRAFTPD